MSEINEIDGLTTQVISLHKQIEELNTKIANLSTYLSMVECENEDGSGSESSDESDTPKEIEYFFR